MQQTRMGWLKAGMVQDWGGRWESCAGMGPFVQMAARETGFGAVEQYMHAGKLLALELLVRVLENPHHHWSALRPEVTAPNSKCSYLT